MTTWVPAWDTTTGEQRARAVFDRAFGIAPDGVWSAPGRVNLIGEHTDYNGGLCLPVALAHRTFAAVRRRGDDTARMVSAWDASVVTALELASVAPGAVDGWTAYVAGVAWALRERGRPVAGFDVAVDSCVPVGSGLSSSAALSCSVALALDAVNALAQDRAALAADCVRAENEIAGAPTGGMDQAAALRTTAGHALLLDCRDLSVRHVPFDPAAEGLALLVIDTRAEHALVDGQYAQRRATCEQAARLLGVTTLRDVTDSPADAERALRTLTDGTPEGDLRVRRVRHVLSEIARVGEFVALLDAGRLRETGPLLDASHASLRDDYEVSCRELDVAVEAARAAGALGARMTGGGFGGSAIALVEADALVTVADAVDAAFAREGLRPPAFVV
ncbi:galactokinase [Cellulomonas palmilytica]|uniref:galactokinase n=1 Tax=Cellulomonas palmilytica TaxID=2608402 RepID=UPI001F38025F|nr:galactokinase [Cellulomonas palmilytica]UJP39673.1 galactokinase [Cellulomonas palmilytica]